MKSVELQPHLLADRDLANIFALDVDLSPQSYIARNEYKKCFRLADYRTDGTTTDFKHWALAICAS
jgi:hypothetical protein